MKKLNIKSITLYLILSVLMVFGINSCKKNNTSGGGGGAPTITRVRTVYQNVTDSGVVHRITLDSNSVYDEPGIAPFDSTTTDGKIGTLYAIIGTNLSTASAIYINGISVYFNVAEVSNTSILFSIPSTVPYSSDSTSNVLTLVTRYGRVNFKFVVEQPVPDITSVDQLAGNPGDVITIAGTTFNGLTGVSFGKIPAQILSTSFDLPTNTTTLKVTVPNGVTYAPIIVTTAATKGGGPGTGPLLTSGTSELSNNVTAVHQANGIFGFNTAIFEDATENNWSIQGGWDGSPYSIDETTVKRGTSSINYTYGGGFVGFIINSGNGNAVDANTAIKFSIRGGKGTTGKFIRLDLNYNFNTSVQITLTEGVWVDYLIPVKNFVDSANPAPATINNLVFQEFSGNASQFNMDDVGLVELK